MGTGVESTEVDKLGAGGSCEGCTAAAAEVHAIWVAGAVVLAGCRGAWIHLLLARGSQVAYKSTEEGFEKPLKQVCT